MRDDQVPESAPAAGTTPVGRGRYRKATLAAALFLTLAGTVAWAPASTGPINRTAHASRVASAAPTILHGQGNQRAVPSAPTVPAGNSPERPVRLGRTAQGIGTRSGGSLTLDGSPGFPPVADPRTGTLYVPIQCRDGAACAGTAEHVVDVINAAKCNAKVASGCRVIARAQAGRGAYVAALDETTNTVYVTNEFANTVSVIDGATCNAKVTRGCGRPLATIKVGKLPTAAALNPRTHTLYVANLAGGSISVINVRACNAVTTSGCRRPVRTVQDKAGPDGVAVDMATNTVYAANSGSSGAGDTVSVFDGAICNGSTGTGCGQAPHFITVGTNPFWDVVDQATDTIYVANFYDGHSNGTVSVINGATCNAKITSGCGSTSPTVPTGAGTSFAEIDAALHTLFAMNQGDDTLSEINTRTCNGTVTSGCPRRPPNEQATFNPPQGYNPNTFALMPQAGTVYLVNGGGENFLAAVSIRHCNATDISGCRAEAPNVPEPEYLTSADPATDTIYAGNLSQPEIDVLNGATCRAGHLTGCAPVAKIPMPDSGANVGAVDEATHTLYASDEASAGALMVINTATCNAEDTSGCADHPPTMKIGAFPSPPVINPATQTVYMSYGTKANRVAVVNAATCNAEDTSGCAQTPGVVTVGKGTYVIAVSTKTDTIYAANNGASFSTGDTVSVINGAACDGTDHSGCGHLAASVKVGLGPYGVAVDDRTRTVYVANNAAGDLPGTVSVINGATCNGTDTAGCKRRMPTVAVGHAPGLVAVDTSTDTVYVNDQTSAAVSVVNGSRCNAVTTRGCSRPAREQAVGSAPAGLSINQRTNTVYVTQVFQSGSLSIFGGARRRP